MSKSKSGDGFSGVEEVGSTMINLKRTDGHVLQHTRADLVGLGAILQWVSRMYCDYFKSISFGHMIVFQSCYLLFVAFSLHKLN